MHGFQYKTNYCDHSGAGHFYGLEQIRARADLGKPSGSCGNLWFYEYVSAVSLHIKTFRFFKTAQKESHVHSLKESRSK